MLHHVGDVDDLSIDARLFEGPVEQPASRTDERPARHILDVARLFPHHHDLRAARSLAEDGLSPPLVQIARLTRACRLTHRSQAQPIGKQLRNGLSGPRLERPGAALEREHRQHDGQQRRHERRAIDPWLYQGAATYNFEG